MNDIQIKCQPIKQILTAETHPNVFPANKKNNILFIIYML